jgi:hypothetical protein
MDDGVHRTLQHGGQVIGEAVVYPEPVLAADDQAMPPQVREVP